MNNNVKRKNSKIKIDAITNNDKKKLNKEIKDNNLLLNEKYTNNMINIDIKIPQNKLKGKNIKSLLPPSQNSQKRGSSIQQFNNSQFSLNSNNTNSTNKDIVKLSINNIEKLYKETNNKIQSLKIENFTNNNLDDILKNEIIFLKTKNEILKLKANFYETVFYSIRSLLDKPEDNLKEFSNNEIPEEVKLYISNLKNKIMCILNQNNQHFYENLNFISNDNSKNMIFTFDNICDNKEEIISKKCLNTINNIEDNLQNLLNCINDFLNKEKENETNENEDKEVYMDFYKIKSEIIKNTKEIISFYLLSENFNFEFKKTKCSFFTNDEVTQHKIKERKIKVNKECDEMINPLIHKVLTKKNKNDIVKYIHNLLSFYENIQKVNEIENSNLKDLNNRLMLQIKNLNIKINKISEEFFTKSTNSIIGLTELIEYLNNNNSNNIEKVTFSLLNTQKQNIIELIIAYNLLKDDIKNLNLTFN